MTRGIPNRQIAEEAADWAIRIDRGSLDPRERRALADWLRASPAHVDELLYCASLLGGLQGVDGERAWPIDDCLGETASEVVPLFRERSRPAAAMIQARGVAGKADRLRWLAAAVVALAIMLGVFTVRPGTGDLSAQDSSKSYATGHGEQRSITLTDGSVVYLNTRSRITVRLSAQERRIDMSQGEALFEVAPDATRPFTVYAANTMVQAVGTKFNVRLTPAGIRVAVVEGKVLVDSRSDAPKRPRLDTRDAASAGLARDQAVLVAGQQAELSAALGVPVVTEADIVSAASWRMRQLSFDDAPLDEIVAEFNRYNRTPIVLADPSLSRRRLSGVFDANDSRSFVAFLELSSSIEVDQSESARILLRPRILERTGRTDDTPVGDRPVGEVGLKPTGWSR